MTNKEKENPLFDETLQTQLDQLISQEYLASRMYIDAVFGVDAGSAGAIADMFTTMSDATMRDGALELAEWCKRYGYSAPCGQSEVKRHAGNKFAALTELKNGQAAGYYIDAAIKIESAVLETYQKMFEAGKISQFTDLQSMAWQMFYAKQNRVQSLATAKTAFLANTDMIMA